MQHIRALENSTIEEEQGTFLAAGNSSPKAFYQGDGGAIQADGSNVRTHAPDLNRHRPTRFGLTCTNCKAFYDSDLPACPICKSVERVPAEEAKAKSAVSPGVRCVAVRDCVADNATGQCKPQMQLALHRDEDGECLLLESSSVLCARTDEIDTGNCSLCILHENQHTQSEYASICLNYEKLREKFARTEAALLIDLREAAQIIYRAVWSDPAPTEPSRTYQNAAEALLNELCRRACIVQFPNAQSSACSS
jgi:hypothetical protein